MKTFKGSYFEIGKQQGEIYKKNGIILNDITPNFSIINNQLNIYKKYYPGVLEELQGIAEGIGCSIDIIHQILLANELKWFKENYSYSEACTIFGVKNRNGLFVGRNLDWISETKEVMEAYRRQVDNKYKLISISDMLIDNAKDIEHNRLFYDAIDAINEKGLYVGITFAHGDSTQFGLSWKDFVKLIGETCKSVDEALELFKTIPLSVPKNFFIADKSGNMVVVEHNSNKYKVVYPKDDILIKTNHFLDPELSLIDNVLKKNPYHNTYKRYSAVVGHINKVKDEVNSEKLYEILSDKANQICQVGDMQTIWSLLMNMKSQDYLLVKRGDNEEKISLNF
jgi:predicted choloylglycine hydrolase